MSSKSRLGGRTTALITGASSGIGYEFSKIFAREGCNVVLVARNQGTLEAIAKELQEKYSVSAIVVPADLSEPFAPDQIFFLLAKEGVTVDYLVNDAGFGMRGAFRETDLKSQLTMMQVNMTALVHLTRLFLDDMVKKGKGGILNLSSTAGFQPGPLMAVYYATKAFVLSFSQALADELKDKGINVTALCPGPTSTGFGKSSGMENSRLFKRGVMSPEQVALAGYRGLMKGKTVVVPGFRNKTLATISRFVPRGYLIRTVRKLNEDPVNETRRTGEGSSRAS
jgi:uncharacterized protein